MVTLGTGIGTGLFLDGKLFPNTELGTLRCGANRASGAPRQPCGTGKLSVEAVGRTGGGVPADTGGGHLAGPIIIGGGVSKEWAKFFPYIHIHAPMVAAELENDAGIVGAAMWAAESAERPTKPQAA